MALARREGEKPFFGFLWAKFYLKNFSPLLRASVRSVYWLPDADMGPFFDTN